MTKLYIVIDERDGIVSPKFQASVKGNAKSLESAIALHIVTAISRQIAAMASQGLAPSSFEAEARKLISELLDLYDQPHETNRLRRSLAMWLLEGVDALEEARG